MNPAVLYDPTNLAKMYGVASTEYYVAVVDDPFVVFEIQEDSDTENMIVGDVGGTIQMLAADCSTTTGLSQFTIDSSSGGTATNTYSWKVLGVVDRPDNALGQYCKWYVLANLHFFRTDITGV
ncbi:hypothetical protein [Candidatus Magnetobacterium casense]|uniref:Uncharacterized protein n=1 Tax=Candidatus Magnetobacterium casense TaxID=1455061 RepID=A0ABS6S3H1_9BACT|nr:hypothetical protein [Candidatus Magnetobacterium casensis]MBV6343381.1 hypothetical protein [Candidatus Magnetobacterium casensis]